MNAELFTFSLIKPSLCILRFKYCTPLVRRVRVLQLLCLIAVVRFFAMGQSEVSRGSPVFGHAPVGLHSEE